MPTYDGIGSSVTHEIEVVGDVFISNVEGGSLSTQVPFEIFSNVSGMVSPPTDSRQVRLRVQPTTEASPDDSYVTDMGIQNTTDNYFFITAPQNTSNVGDQNTFVISKTSNVGIGTTNPEKPLHVVGDSWITGTLTASNIIGASPVTISSNLVMASGFTLTAGAIEPPAGAESNLKITGTITTSNIVGSSFLTVTANTNVVAEFTESSRYYNVKEPRSAMTANSSFGYTASVSSELSSNWTGWKAFNGIVGDDGWHDAGSKYSTINGSYDGSNSLGGYSGEWIKLQLPDSIKLTQIRIAPRNLHSDRAPKDAVCLGSTDGSNWYSLTSWTGATYTDGSFTNFYVNTDNYYSYIAIVTTRIDSLNGTLNISEIEYYGTPYTAATNDGTDVLLKTVPNTPKTDFLEVYYDAKEYESGNITDESGNGNTGTPTNVTFNSTEPKSFEFNGTSSYISATFNSNTLDAGNVHSICMWIKPNAIQSSYKSLFQCGQASNDSSTGVFLVNGRVAFLHFGSNLESDYLVEVDKWYFITCTYSPGRKIYVNSQFVTSDSYSALNISNFSAKLGANLSNAELFNGSIANYRLYDRALSADEIWEIYSYQKAYFSVSPDVVTYKAGRVGIGTSEPRAVLDVVGDAMFSEGSVIPAFNAYKSDNGAQVYGETDYIWNSEYFDRLNNYDTTNGRFTAPSRGYYYFWASFEMYGTDATPPLDAYRYAQFYKNGSLYTPTNAYTPVQVTGNSHQQFTLAHVIYLEASDYVTVRTNDPTRGMQSSFLGFKIGA
jgi:hypothetical protein